MALARQLFDALGSRRASDTFTAFIYRAQSTRSMERFRRNRGYSLMIRIIGIEL